MASTLNSVPAANSASGNAVNSSAQNSGRPSLRSSGNTKGDGRRQSGSPVDGGQRYVPTTTFPPPSILHLVLYCPHNHIGLFPPGVILGASQSIRMMGTFGPSGTPLQPMCKLGARAFKLRMELCVHRAPIGFLGIDRCDSSSYLCSMIVGCTPH